MSHRKWKETKQQPGTAGPGNILGCCLVSLCFLCDIHSVHGNFQSGLVFGIVHLSGFVAASLMSIVGDRFSVRTMAFLGAFLQGVAVMAFGMLEFTEDVVLFLTLSYLLRYDSTTIGHLMR